MRDLYRLLRDAMRHRLAELMRSVDPFIERAYHHDYINPKPPRRRRDNGRLHPTTPKHRRSLREWVAHNGPCLILCVPLHILLEHMPWI